jgi:hypothetical protein
MLPEISQLLSKIVERKRLKEKLERDLQAVQDELRDSSTRLASLSARLEREKVDVEKLERTTLTALFYSALGNRQQQLEKERQEMLSAQLQYQQTKHQAAYLEREQDRLSEQIAGLSGVESEYQSLLAEKERLLRQSNQAVEDELMKISQQIGEINLEIKETDEAIQAGNEVLSGLERVIESLHSAEGWGTWDMLGGGFLSTAIKHDRIDEARDGVHYVQAKMSRFKRELADVRNASDLQIKIGALDTFADYFFDGLIIDWIVQSEITDSLEQAVKTKNLVAQAVDTLEGAKSRTQQEQRDLEEKRRQIILRS